MRHHISIFSVLALASGIVFSSLSCGESTDQNEVSDQEQNKNGEAQTELTESAAGMETIVAVPLKGVQQNPMDYSGKRYIREMVNEELNRTYSEGGEYIDPRKVITLLRDGGEDAEGAPPPEQDAEKTWRISYLAHQEANKLFDRGDFVGAAEKWRSLPTDSQAFTIAVEVDCDTGILKTSLNKLRELESPVFMVRESVGGRTCYRICVGIFQRRADAGDWIAKVRTLLSGTYPFIYIVSRK